MESYYLKSNIKYLRKSYKLTQEQLSVPINVSRSALGAWEEGRSAPQIDALLRLSRFFDYSIDDLIKIDLSGGQVKPLVSEVILSSEIGFLINKHQIQFKTVRDLMESATDTEHSKYRSVCSFISGFIQDLKALKDATLPKASKEREAQAVENKAKERQEGKTGKAIFAIR
jgi:transcriptional regulator with XRE-family HTH domain